MLPLINQQKNLTQQSDDDNDSRKFVKEKRKKCVVCKKKCSYQCPQCKVSYCSVAHYKSHNLFCTEEFYKKQVQQNLKNMKITDKKQKIKAQQLIKEHQKLLEDETMPSSFTQERLVEILEMLESGKPVELASAEEEAFLQFLTKIQNPQDESDHYEGMKQFWEIEDGLGMYLLEQPQIQEYNESQFPDLIVERFQFSQRMKDFKLNHQQKVKASPMIKYHIYQIAYLGILLYRIFDGQQNEDFTSIFLQVYFSQDNEKLLVQKDGVSCLLMLTQIDKQLLNLTKSSDLASTIQEWVYKMKRILALDVKAIVKNKFLLIEIMFRLMNAFMKKQEKNWIRIKKKIQFLCCYILQNFQLLKDLPEEGLAAIEYLQKMNSVGAQIKSKV